MIDGRTVTVAVCGVRGQIRPETILSVVGQVDRYHQMEQDPDNPWDYANALRELWRAPGELIVLEQDVVVPEGAIANLLACDEDWCTHPHWTGSRYDLQTLGLVKFGGEMRYLFRHLADRALGRRDPNGPHAAVRFGDIDPWGSPDPWDWPTTIPWHQCDTQLAKALIDAGYAVHIHNPPTRHLRHYTAQEDERGRSGRMDPGL